MKNDNNRLVAAVLAWMIPGCGHWYLGQKNRGIILFVTIGLTFLLGLVLGSTEVVDPQAPGMMAKMAFVAQMGCGFVGLLGILVQDMERSILQVYGRGVDLGQLYTVIAGLLNLLCVLNLLEIRQRAAAKKLHKLL